MPTSDPGHSRNAASERSHRGRRLCRGGRSGFTAVLLSACHPQSTAPREAVAAHDLVACARSNARLAIACTVERARPRQGSGLGLGQGLVLTLRHPDGAFRRLLVTRDGRGVVAADGAEPATTTVLGRDTIEVAIGGERYRLPATVGSKR